MVPYPTGFAFTSHKIEDFRAKKLFLSGKKKSLPPDFDFGKVKGRRKRNLNSMS